MLAGQRGLTFVGGDVFKRTFGLLVVRRVLDHPDREWGQYGSLARQHEVELALFTVFGPICVELVIKQYRNLARDDPRVCSLIGSDGAIGPQSLEIGDN